MALLSNINDKFAVDSTGAIQFNGQVGTSGYVLKSNANAAPTWVDPSTVIGGPYLPLTGGTLTGATATASGISFTVGGTLTGTTATFSGDVNVEDNLYLTDAGTVRGKIQLNSSDRDNLDIKAISLGSLMRFYTVDTLALTLDASQNATFASDVYVTGTTNSNVVISRDNMYLDAGQFYIGADDSVTDDSFRQRTASGSYFIESRKSGTWTNRLQINSAGTLIAGQGATFAGAIQTTQITATNGLNYLKRNTDASLQLRSENTRSGLFITKPATDTVMGSALVLADESYRLGTANHYHMYMLQNGNTYFTQNVGIGETSPATKLDVRGTDNGDTVRISNTGTYGGTISFTQGSSDTNIGYVGSLRALEGNASGDNGIGLYSRNRISFYTNSATPDVTISDNGNVGIGTTSPGQKLEVTGNTYVTGYVQASSAIIGNKVISSVNYATFGSNSTATGVALSRDWNPTTYPDLIINPSGNVGIGVINPTSGNLVLPQEESTQFKIAFTGASSSSGISTVDQSGSGLYIGANSRVNSSGVVQYHDSALDSSGIYFDGWNGNDMEFYTALSGTPQKRMVIDGYGRVNIYQQLCVGSTTAPTNEKLLVQSGISNGSEIWRFGTSGRYTFTGHKFFNSITGTATNDGWYTIGNVGDSSSVIINIQTAAHSSATILASRGYGPSNVARIQVLSSTKNANGGYANIKAVRISGGGIIDMQLTWSSGPYVSVHLAYYGLGCDMPTTLALSISNTGTYPYNVTDTATFRNTAASARVSGELDIASQTHCGSNINMYSTSKIFFHATTNSGRYIGASSTNDLDIAADDDINYRSNYNRFFNGSTEFARLSGSGNSWIANGSNGKLGVANTSPSYNLDVTGTARITSRLGINTAPDTAVAGDVLKIQGGNNGLGCIKAISGAMSYGVRIEGSNLSTQLALYTSSTSQTTQINFEVAGNSSAGKITTTTNTTTYTTSSDYRLKENVVPISDSISRLNQLKPSRFNFIEEPNKTVDGFIAHEVQDIVPEAIVGEKDGVDENGGIIPQGIDQAKLVPLLVAAIQELEARVKELENK